MKLLKYKLTAENNHVEIPIDPENPSFTIIAVHENIPNPDMSMGQVADLILNYTAPARTFLSEANPFAWSRSHSSNVINNPPTCP